MTIGFVIISLDAGGLSITYKKVGCTRRCLCGNVNDRTLVDERIAIADDKLLLDETLRKGIYADNQIIATRLKNAIIASVILRDIRN